MTAPDVLISEVGPRDGLQSVKATMPTSDKLRETLFNVIAARVPGARVLDGFAGTGALGLEALSRGADHATFIESDRRAWTLIEENAAACGAANACAIIRTSSRRHC